MNKSKFRRKTTPIKRDVRKGGDLHCLHIKVSSPRIVMHQIMSGIGKGIKCGVLLVLLALIAYGGHRGVKHLFLGNEKYRLQEIDLQTNGSLDHARVLELTGIQLRDTIFAVDTGEVRARLEELPEVVDCLVERRLPGTLKIRIEERVPIAWVRCETLGFPGQEMRGVLVDEQGITFPCEGALWDTSKGLPVIVLNTARSDEFRHGNKTTHMDLLRALHLLSEFYAMGMREQWLPEQIAIINDYSMELRSLDGSKSVFGMYEHKRQLDNFITIREHSLKTDRKVRHINLMPTKNIPVKFAGDPVLVKPGLAAGP